jgi:hypothetical protein
MIEADSVPAGRIEDRRFLWGILLVGASSIPVLVEVFNSFRGLSENKATGMGAVAGGIAEGFVTFGLACALLFSVFGAVFLVRAFSREHWLRSILSVLAICFSALTMIFVVFSFWFIYWGMRR